jgi:hypothetical protein
MPSAASSKITPPAPAATADWVRKSFMLNSRSRTPVTMAVG